MRNTVVDDTELSAEKYKVSRKLRNVLYVGSCVEK